LFIPELEKLGGGRGKSVKMDSGENDEVAALNKTLFPSL